MKYITPDSIAYPGVLEADVIGVKGEDRLVCFRAQAVQDGVILRDRVYLLLVGEGVPIRRTLCRTSLLKC